MSIVSKHLASIHTLLGRKTFRFIKYHICTEIFLHYVNGKMLTPKWILHNFFKLATDETDFLCFLSFNLHANLQFNNKITTVKNMTPTWNKLYSHKVLQQKIRIIYKTQISLFEYFLLVSIFQFFSLISRRHRRCIFVLLEKTYDSKVFTTALSLVDLYNF